MDVRSVPELTILFQYQFSGFDNILAFCKISVKETRGIQGNSVLFLKLLKLFPNKAIKM